MSEEDECFICGIAETDCKCNMNAHMKKIIKQLDSILEQLNQIEYNQS